MTNKNLLAKYLSQKSNFDYINSSIDESQRRLRLAELTKTFESQTKFSSVNFSSSGYVEDSTGIPNSLDDDFAAEQALSEIKRLVIREDVQKMLVPQINAKNDITKRNAQRKLEFQEQLQKNY